MIQFLPPYSFLMNHPNLYTSIQIFLDCIEKYEINNHLNNTIKEVNQHTTSSDSIYLKDKLAAQ